MVVSYISWSGTPRITAVHNGGGSVTFTLSGGTATVYFDNSTTEEAAYEIFCNNEHVAYMTTSGKTVTVELPPSTRTYICKGYVVFDGVKTTTTSGDPTLSFTVPGPDFVWSQDAKLTAEDIGNDNYQLTLTGTVTTSNGYSGHTLYFVWYKDNTSLGRRDSQYRTLILSPAYQSDTSIYSVAACIRIYDPVAGVYIDVLSTTGNPSTMLGGYVSYYNGSSWVKCKPRYYNGSAWVDCKPHYYNGSGWVDTI